MDRISYTKSHSLGVFSYKYADDNGYEFIGYFKSLEVWRQCDELDAERYYALVRPHTNLRGHTIMELDLERQGDYDSWEVMMSRISKRYQGFGLAPKFYKWLLRNEHLVLEAGSSQSVGGRYIWNVLASFPRIEMIAIDRLKNIFSVEVGDDGEIYSEEVEIYDGSKNIRVLACYQ